MSLIGVDGHVVEVEADLAQGLPGLTVTGLPDAALSEARDRVRAAVVNSGHAWPQKRITLGLSPASLPKRGSGFDLALAAAILAADGAVPSVALIGRVLLGELGLDGRVRSVRGVLPAVLTAVRAGFGQVIVPMGNLAEARLLPGVQADGVATLRGLVALLRGEPFEEACPAGPVSSALPALALDMLDVAGQVRGRTAMEVAAAGGHHAFLLGPPGSGKTMVAERMPGLLPPLELKAALEVTAVHSVAGTLPTGEPLVRNPLYQDPHHTSTVASIVGGGGGVARPGAASLAHHGVLFLDEAPEFATGVLDALRQPLESGRLSITRVGGTAVYPARFTLLLAANPCPCGKDPRDCTCRPEARRRYLNRLSGPLLDRIDLHVDTPPITRSEIMAEGGCGEPSADIAARVLHARQRAAERLRDTPWRINGEVPPVELRRRWQLPSSVTCDAERALDTGQLTARGFGRVLRLAWTLSDLADAGRPGREHVGHALGFRSLRQHGLAA